MENELLTNDINAQVLRNVNGLLPTDLGNEKYKSVLQGFAFA